jgi:hypothetical protein
VSDARKALNKAESNPTATQEQLDTARQRLQAAQDAFSQAERPPVKGTYLRPGMGPSDGEHAAAAEAHQTAVDARVYAEGEPPTPEPKAASKIFAMAGQRVNQGVDTAGNTWIGTGHAMIRGDTLAKAAAQTAKLKTSVTQTVQPDQLTRVLTPKPNVDYQPVTWERRVTTPEGVNQVIGTLPDGTHIAVQKPVFDALHTAAGTDGTIVSARKGDDRIFARNAQGETTGVGMPIRMTSQAQARIYARGPQAAVTPPKGGPKSVTDLAPSEVAPAAQELVPGPQPLLDQAGTTEPTGPTPEVQLPGADLAEPGAQNLAEVSSEEVAPAPGSQLEKLLATRERLAGQAALSQQDTIKLRSVEKQIRQLQSKARKGQPTQTQGPLAVPRGEYIPKDFGHYKFNNGTSVWRSVFEAAGHDPDLAVNKPLAWQNKVLGDHLRDTFGFRDVTVASGTNPMFARDTMLDLTRAAQDMANSLGMRAALISLDGRLAFQLEPRGARSYLGMYDGGTKTIHLVNDANSFGHEWIHAVDHLLTEQLLNNPQHQHLLSVHTRAGDLDTRDGTQAAFAKLINTMFYDSGAEMLQWYKLEQDAARIDKAGNPTKAAIEARRNLEALNKGASRQRIQPSQFRLMAVQFGDPNYWASSYEMLARTGEAWIARQMENNGVDPRGVVMPDAAYLNETDQRLRMTFPKDEERTAIFAAYSDLFDRLKNDGIITGPTAPKADFPGATIGWSQQTPKAAQRTSFGQAVRRELNGLAAGTRKILHPIRELTGGDLRPAPPKGLSAKTRAADRVRVFLNSYGANMRVIIARHPGPGGRALQAIYDRVAPPKGSGRAVGETFIEDHRAMDNILRNRMGQIFTANGIDNLNDMTALEGAMIHHVMTTGDKTYPHDPLNLSPNAPSDPIPQNLQRIAGALQGDLLNPLYRELDTAGFSVGVAPNGYFPRIYDEQRVYSNPTGFKEAATRMHQLMFDKDVGAPGDNPGRLLERWMQLTKAERALADPSIPTAMKALRKNLRQQAEVKEQLKANPGDAALQAKLDALEDEARQLAEDNHELVRDHVAMLAAEDWAHRIIAGDPLEFEKLGPSGRFLNRRVLPPEADQIMREFMHVDPRVALPRYFDSTSRRLAWAKAFGKESEFLTDQIKKAEVAGVSGPDIQRFQSLLNQATGRMTYKADREIVQASQQVHAAGAILLMSRAVWTSLAEPMNAAMATGELGAAWKTFTNQLGAALGKADARERAEIADMLGVTTSAAYDSIMQARTGAEYADSPATDRFMGQFYRATFLTQITTSQRRAAVGTADWLLHKWSRDLTSTEKGNKAADRKAEAERMFRELGLTSQGNNLRDQFVNWILSHDGPVPISELGTSEFRGVYGLAIRRLVDRMIQSPYKIDRPQTSGTPWLSLATQLMSFNYSYMNNIFDPFMHRLGRSYSRGYERGYDKAKTGGAGDFGAKFRGFTGGAGAFNRTLATSAIIVGLTIFANLLTSTPRQYLFSKDQWDQHVKNGDLGSWLLGVAISRSGIGGTLDPIGQVFDHFRWASDLSTLYQGATPGHILRNLKDLIMPLVGQAESPNSNTQYYNQARAFYNLIMVPLEVLGLTMMNASGAPVTQASTSGLMQWLTSPEAANRFAAILAGPKGSEKPKAVSDDTDDAGADLPSTEGLDMPEGKPRQPGGAASSSLPQVPLGILDDVAVPLVKVLEQAWKVTPGYAKLAAPVIAVALYGTHWWNETASWRDHPKRATGQ